ncbi:MAG: serine/threonine protein kinase [bacterium]
MTSKRWQQIKDLFEAALECEPSQRTAYLDAACAGDSALREQVESLLASHEQAPGFLEMPVLGAGPIRLEQETESLVGKLVGPYRIERAIGYGGMGVVYLAVRADDQYQKHVAIKLVKRGMDTEEIIQRFRNERQILASLDHPNIARLFDGGITAEGLPYFVMEYIEGLPIDVYCDRHKLNTIERLKLFRAVCSAVHYAHQHLINRLAMRPSRRRAMFIRLGYCCINCLPGIALITS